MMPKMDGYELVRSIRESGSSIPIMMITAKDAFDDMRPDSSPAATTIWSSPSTSGKWYCA